MCKHIAGLFIFYLFEIDFIIFLKKLEKYVNLAINASLLIQLMNLSQQKMMHQLYVGTLPVVKKKSTNKFLVLLIF